MVYVLPFPCASVGFFFFFKQKTAYDMRISDWSSDVCSSDLTLLSASQYGQNCPSVRRAISFATIFCTSSGRLASNHSRSIGRSISRISPSNVFEGASSARMMSADKEARECLLAAAGSWDNRVADEIGIALCRERGCQDG